jgi:hypothetical protein
MYCLKIYLKVSEILKNTKQISNIHNGYNVIYINLNYNRLLMINFILYFINRTHTFCAYAYAYAL